jgi:phosphatidylserine/phosphatidylglycerophosphate/cardiolipin synthase-like enzyme
MGNRAMRSSIRWGRINRYRANQDRIYYHLEVWWHRRFRCAKGIHTPKMSMYDQQGRKGACRWCGQGQPRQQWPNE